jgi:hypothetical protein
LKGARSDSEGEEKERRWMEWRKPRTCRLDEDRRLLDLLRRSKATIRQHHRRTTEARR